MKKSKELPEEVIPENSKSNTVRVYKNTKLKNPTQLKINKAIIGDSIEIMIEKIRAGEGEEGIPDRDLVYNDNESTTINPLTNIRSDKMELMLEEKIGEYDHKHRKPPMKIVTDESESKEEEKAGESKSQATEE